jgi:hypothetical protein
LNKKLIQRIKKPSASLILVLLGVLIVCTGIFFAIRISVIQQIDLPVLVPKSHAQKVPLLGDESIFGQYSRVEEPQKADINREVVGLVADPVDPQSSAGRVVLRDLQGESKIYRIGSPLPGGYKITQIFPEKIILVDSQGFSYYLNLLKPSLELGTSSVDP